MLSSMTYISRLEGFSDEEEDEKNEVLEMFIDNLYGHDESIWENDVDLRLRLRLICLDILPNPNGSGF